jgi:hypothetical protein
MLVLLAGGGLNTNSTPEANLAKLMQREIGRVPEAVVYLAQFFHEWRETRERPGEARKDLIFLHFARVSEEDISFIVLNPKEYDAAAGILRYDGTQEVRPVVKAMYRRYHEFLAADRLPT